MGPALAPARVDDRGPVLHDRQPAQPRRFLNGSNARPYRLRLSNGQAFQLIASEGGLLEAPVTLTELPIWPAERYEVVIDFGALAPGTSVFLDNGEAL